MACDECSMMRATLNDALTQVAHLERLLSTRDIRQSDMEVMNKMLHSELNKRTAVADTIVPDEE